MRKRPKITEHEIDSTIGEDTTVSVFFSHEPEEPAVLSGPYPYPGAHAQVVIWAVIIGEDDVSDDLSSDCLARLEERCWDYLEKL